MTFALAAPGAAAAGSRPISSYKYEKYYYCSTRSGPISKLRVQQEQEEVIRRKNHMG